LTQRRNDDRSDWIEFLRALAVFQRVLVSTDGINELAVPMVSQRRVVRRPWRCRRTGRATSPPLINKAASLSRKLKLRLRVVNCPRRNPRNRIPARTANELSQRQNPGYRQDRKKPIKKSKINHFAFGSSPKQELAL